MTNSAGGTTGHQGARPLSVAVVGSGVAGLACAWLLARRHRVTLYEASQRLGGHAHTVEAPTPAGPVAVDTGFIVYNEATYPNLKALFAHLGVRTQPADMSFGVSLDEGRLEYGSAHPLAIFAQPSNLARPRFWRMLRDLVRFYREAPQALAALELQPCSLGELLDRGGYSQAFQDDHLLPQVGAIWSTSPLGARDYPALALIRFFENHGLLKLVRRPQWRTVTGGSRAYLAAVAADFGGEVRLGAPVISVSRRPDGVRVRTASEETRYDQVVIASHADEALAMLEAPTIQEREVLGAFRYGANLAVLHDDPSFMPRRRAAWSAWNHLGRRGAPAGGVCVTYWMNMLQSLPKARELFVTLNPPTPVPADRTVGSYSYDHPLFDAAALAAQTRLWSLQGDGGVWYCGAHFGAGFHEDGLQSGLAVAEALGGVRRPWSVEGESARIHLDPVPAPGVTSLAA